MLSQRLGCPDAANDVFQMLSEHILSAKTADQVTHPVAYVYRAASNMASTFQRAAARRRAYEGAAIHQDIVSEIDSPEAFRSRDETYKVLERALDELPVLTRQMFIAFRVHGIRQKDIARKFGVSLSTVEKRIAKATLHCHRRLIQSVTPSERPGAPCGRWQHE